ncbi:metal-dependent hydrolase [Alkaliphilus peptidifermentans]|uniref:Inner membrane protein n=1 Tax=Alkaliphilus peptidifermentans DSM 18978 TaxID=1120976 RepID=A0A1G5CUZ4_9FIRM|nr:metal-dependent hydrolase [Alkaliphilus peptidifermentans]SCY06081.1 inner membrane protein [Alkaliphilus peptidifermentans DSM 18978]
MDPLSHAIIGLSIHGLSQAPSLGNPASIGALIGAIAPDLDIITRIKGDYVYLKHHRVETHSIPGIIGVSLLITLGLSLIYSSFVFREVFLWTMIGALSHVVFDLLNSYGVALLYPLNRKKYSINLIMIYDPVVILLSGYILFFSGRTFFENLMMGVIMLAYLILKALDKKSLKRILQNQYCKGAEIRKITIMPSDYNPLKWDYIVKTKEEYLVGDIKSFRGIPNQLRRFTIITNSIIEKSLKEELGQYFESFTPFFHIDFKEEKDRIIVKMTDLRYRVTNGFKHHAIFHYNNNAQLEKSVFHPFKMDNQITIKNDR